MRFTIFDEAFPTLFNPMVVPDGHRRKESDAVLACFSEFLETASTEDEKNRWLFPTENTLLQERNEQRVWCPVVADVLKSMRKMSESFCALHAGETIAGNDFRSRDGLTPTLIHESLKGLELRGYWGMWVPSQNGVLLVHRTVKDENNEEIACVYAWEAQASNREVMGRNQSVRQKCPRSAMSVPWNRFQQPSVAECLWELAATETPDKAVPKSRKSGEVVGETRDVVNPMYLIEFFLAALGGDGIPTNTIRGVHKKMKDQVVYSGGELPWRRAPLWAALKSLLHVVCVMETTKAMGSGINRAGEVIYKVVVQNFLAFCLDNSNAPSVSSKVEAVRKIVRRLAKVEKILENPWEKHRFFQASSDTCAMVIRSKTDVCESDWKKKCNEPVTCSVELDKICPEKDITHQLRSSRPILTKLLELKENIYRLENSQKIPNPVGRNFLIGREMSDQLLKEHRDEILKAFENWEKNPQDIVGHLIDVATNASSLFMDIRSKRRQLNLNEANSLVPQLTELLDSYSTIGLKLYDSDPRGCGEIVIISLSMVIVVDMIACAHFPILKEHKLGIDPKFLQHVFAPTVANKKMICELEKYINERNTPDFPSSVEKDRSSRSLSVRFASQNASMKATLEQIQERCRSNQLEKAREFKRKRERYNDLQLKIQRQGACSCYWTYDSRGYRQHHIKCTRCRLDDEARGINLTYYEMLLPPNHIQRLAVVFELEQPYLLVAQRAAILFLNEKISKMQWYVKSDHYLWSQESRLNQWSRTKSAPLVGCELGSIRKKFTQSHYSHSDHVTKHQSFIVNHDYETLLVGPHGIANENITWIIKPNLCSNELKSTSRYKNLESFFNSFSHSENEIIAFKSEASEDLTLNEFESVGTLRAGANHQLIRLSSCFAQGGIDLKREEIVSLISSTLWQAGPASTLNEVLSGLGGTYQAHSRWHRQQSEILQDPTFVVDFCLSLKTTLDGCSSNWANTNILLNVTHIAMCVNEHVYEYEYCTSDKAKIRDNVVNVVNKCRRIAQEWIQKLTEAFDLSINDNEKQELRSRIAFVAATGSLTFADSDALLSKKSDVAIWIHFRTTFSENFSPAEMKKQSHRRELFFHAYAVAESIEQRLLSALKHDKSGLTKFLELYWGTKMSNLNWMQCEARRWFHVDHADCTLQVEVITGDVLVNGMPPKNPPRSITSHETFCRLFGKATFMTKAIGNRGYRTSSKVNGFFYEFYPPLETRLNNAPVIVKESEGLRAILVPWFFFQSDLPVELVNEYTHWFITASPCPQINESPCPQINECCVYFRPKSHKMEIPSSGTNIQDHFIRTSLFKLDCRQLSVSEMKSKNYLIDIQSETFKELFTKVLTRLSPASRIHLSVSQTIGDKIQIRIPVMQNIRFTLNRRTGCIHSSDFQGLQVSKNQNFGALLGMKHGLLLEGELHSENRIFLCPHGKVTRNVDGSVAIDVENLRSPTFFRFEIRPELKILRSCTKERIASLFLAHLHASSSGIFVDPFTRTTGTQRALTILRSGHCAGNLINCLDEGEIKESLLNESQILTEIASISYKRENYHDMEKNNASSSSYDALCASSVFAFIAKIRLDDIEDALKAISGVIRRDCTREELNCISARTSALSCRAYTQNHETYAKDSMLNQEEEEKIFGNTISNDASVLPLKSGFNSETISFAQNLAFALHNRCSIQNNVSSLSDLLCSRRVDSLQGITNQATLRGGPMQSFGSLFHPLASRKLDFHHIWLNLYDVCRTQIKDDPDRRTSLSFLMVWVLTEFPDKKAFLEQLSVVAYDPNSFPRKEDFDVQSNYIRPHEKDYCHSDVRRVIDSCFTKFNESPPERSHEYMPWTQRRDHHNDIRRNEMNELEKKIRFQWRNGHSSIHVSTNFSLLHSGSKNALVNDINELFDRWRKARRLHDFLTKVKEKMREIQTSNHGFFVPLDYDNAVDLSSPRENFVLPTGPNSLSEQEVKSAAQHFLRGIKPYTFEFEPSRSNGKPNVLSFLEKSSFLKRHPEYQQVWDALVQPLQKSWSLACNDEGHSSETLESHRYVIETQLKRYAERAEDCYSKCDQYIADVYRQERRQNVVVQLQNRVGLWNSTSPYDLILQCFGHPIGEQMQQGLLSFAISIKHVQRARRCLRLLLCETNSGLQKHLLSDLSIRFRDSIPGLNVAWSAYDHPEFLLFEIDNDIGVRDIQAEVAFEILKENHDNIENTRNRLMQLNMGEGKTAVIMPLVLARAARGDKLVRATVLSSLYRTNASDWQYKLGGILNRRVYPMICRRDVPIGRVEARDMLQRCMMIREKKHVIVTVPEHRLSLENKALELASDLATCAALDASKGLHKVLGYIWKNAREFLDESDEILSPKYQLIYTLGSPCDMEGAQLRWETHSCIYESINRHASSLIQDFGTDTIELGKRSSPERKYEYIGFRLIEGSPRCDEAYNKIKKHIVDDILSGETNLKICLRREEKQKWEICVLGKGNGNDVGKLPASAKVLALCLRGMLGHDVLKTVLFKRWRVQYGNHPTRKRFDMAVPYRAKDVAAERTEYGHPDVALSLTFAHYFQGGLKEEQLRNAFEKLQLMRESDAKAEYNSWVADISEEVEGIGSYDGVNMDDVTLFESKLFPTFRKNMRVIRFWLVNLILPVQAKQFPKKLSSTAPELCRSPRLGSHWAAVTTGFSGTDDLSLLLPPTIVQKNIEKLIKTNGVQLRNLLRAENNQYCHLVEDDTTGEIINKILDTKRGKPCIDVVLDAGALVLHKSNRAFVKAWLEKRRDMEAGAFFEGSTIFVLRKDDVLMHFDSSPYCTQMSKCLLYLDEIHTRGSDFRLPSTTRALLTLGKGMQKDKFVQACMRMRQLGHGQSITFVASREVHRVLETDFCSTRRDNELGYISAILEWTISNSVKQICDYMPYFLDQMRTTLKKSIAYNKNFEQGGSCLKSLVGHCVEDEILELMQLYGHERGDDSLPNIVDHRLGKHFRDGEFVELVNEVRQKIRQLAPHLRVPWGMLDEELERELEQELEEERNIERPPPAKPLKPRFSGNLLLVLQLAMDKPEAFPKLCQKHFKPLSSIFRETSFSETPIGNQLIETDDVFVTEDFVNTIEGKADKDFYMKNIRWYLRWGTPQNMSFVVISNFEAEKLSNLLASTIQQNRDRFPSLYAFAPITRLHQRSGFLPPSSCDPPVVVHVFAGSIHADEVLLTKIRNYLSVFPRPITPRGRDNWDKLFDDGAIQRDGFVPPEHRRKVDEESSNNDFDGTSITPFRRSPVSSLKRFLADSRNLGSELPTSSVGKLLGASKLESCFKDEE